MTGSTQAAPAAISCRGVSKVWNADGDKPFVALKDIDLEVRPGEFVVLLGPSGCGKSTLLYLLAGLEQATRGQLLSAGRPITGTSPERGMIFQDAALFPWLDILGNVAYGLALQGVARAEREATARALIARVGLAGFEHKRPSELSGGMRQRAAMARALALSPKVLMLDEPFAALDIQTRAKMQNYLLDLWRQSGARPAGADGAESAEGGTSMLLVTHSIEEAIGLADRILVFTARPGRVKEIVPVDLPRPRNPRDAAFHALHDRLAELLADEVDRAFAEQEAAVR
ncbi:ABC transporter ATP-binding protein [Pseudorhodoferax sp. Leaf274]|uniref:ABC transporter ATP-binding protein n=1 Tax=Pseudorhodoferax sp. Leaf274 TaxID=1736318 RepID=UPI0007028E83|nr:ABC transporter ATP-binding protein [Pseudorhodoferax sp. Leaf274]KQP38993.1 ABC transporter ATP-binding protein [Pseudorhodoferax sp. Leaf274]